MNCCRALLFAICLALLSAAPAAATESHGSTLPGAPNYVRLKPIAFSVIGPDNKIDKEVSVLLDLEMEPDKTDAMLDPYRRQMMDAFLLALSDIYTERKPGDPPVAGEDLKERLLQVATGVAGPGLVHGVLIMSIGERGHTR
jgi:hypothetical protein